MRVQVSVVALLSMSLALGACVGDAPSGPTGLSVFPSTTLYSGVETGSGAIPYKVTIAAMGATGVQWTSADPTIATVTGTDTLGTVTSLQAGMTTITATAAGATVQIPLVVQSYNVADRQAAAPEWTGTCASAGCHDAAGPDVSPSDIGKHTDAQVQGAVTMGQNPEGGPVSIGATAHSFALTGTSLTGITAYVRSLPPGTPKQDN